MSTTAWMVENLTLHVLGVLEFIWYLVAFYAVPALASGVDIWPICGNSGTSALKSVRVVLHKMVTKYVSCESDRLNRSYSTLQAAWYSMYVGLVCSMFHSLYGAHEFGLRCFPRASKQPILGALQKQRPKKKMKSVLRALFSVRAGPNLKTTKPKNKT